MFPKIAIFYKATNDASNPTVSPNASATYEKLIAYKIEGYKKQSIADFNTTLALTLDITYSCLSSHYVNNRSIFKYVLSS